MGAARTVAAAIVSGIMLASSPSAAHADEGDATDPIVAEDPGIASLHEAILEWKEARVALRDECPNNGTADCRAKMKDLRTTFKDARREAIAAHHTFVQLRKDERDAAKNEAKANREQTKAEAKSMRDQARADAKAQRDAAKAEKKAQHTAKSSADSINSD